MTYEEYLSECKDFARDTAKWAELDRYQFYTTNGNGWNESCDNGNGGISIAWAFHQTDSEIEAEAPQQFANEFVAQLQAAIDNEATEPDQLQCIVDLFS